MSADHDADVLRLCVAFRHAMDAADPLDRLVGALSRAAASPGPSAIMATNADLESRWQQMHQRREQRDARLAPARERGLAAYEAARARFGREVPAGGPSPFMSAMYGGDSGRPLIF